MGRFAAVLRRRPISVCTRAMHTQRQTHTDTRLLNGRLCAFDNMLRLRSSSHRMYNAPPGDKHMCGVLHVQAILHDLWNTTYSIRCACSFRCGSHVFGRSARARFANNTIAIPIRPTSRTFIALRRRASGLSISRATHANTARHVPGF